MNDEEDQITTILNGTPDFFINTNGRNMSFYLSGPLEGPEKYTQWFHIIRNSSPNDVIRLHINSPGGNADSALQFMRVMRESAATIVASVEGNCSSAMTMIFLSADVVEISPHSIFMFHNYSGGMAGKGGEMFQQITHMKQWSEDLLRDVYTDFLTETEINNILNNQDIWMSADEAGRRIDKKIKALKKGVHKKKASLDLDTN